MLWSIVVFALLLLGAAVCLAEDLTVLKAQPGQAQPSQMMETYLRDRARSALARRQAEYETLKTPEQIRSYQHRMREFFLQQLGGLPERTPLHAQVVGTLSLDGYRVQKITYSSQPGLLVTATLYLPESAPPYPVVLIPCGHDKNGKAAQAYQRAAMLLTRHGIAAFCYDPIGQGERSQLLDADGKARFGPTVEHTLVGVGSILLGTNTARYRVWDGMRAIDYLVSRDDIDAQRIGCTGNSGGGTLTGYLMALDDRVACAAPSCYLTAFARLVETIGPQDAEQNIAGQIAFGMDHADYIIMRAPRPTLICAGTRDFFDIDGTWQTFRQAKRIYTRLGYPERVDLAEADVEHGFSSQLRVAMVQWMCRWLLGKDEPICDEDSPILSDEQLRCTPGGQVMLLAGARSVFELNADLNNRLAEERQRIWRSADKTDALQRVRQLAGIAQLADLPEPLLQTLGTVSRPGYRIKKLVLQPEPGICLPALAFTPPQPHDDAYLYLHGNSKSAHADVGGPIEKLVRQGHLVLAVDLRGLGEAEPKEDGQWSEYFGPDSKNILLAYLLGKSYLGMRAQDILVCARFLAGYRAGQQPPRVHVIAMGEVGPAALHAAALEPQLFASVRLDHSLVSWSSVVQTPTAKNQLVNAVHGALRVYDLPDLLTTLPPEKVTVTAPLDAAGELTELAR